VELLVLVIILYLLELPNAEEYAQQLVISGEHQIIVAKFAT
jgi:hypothetical protein